MTIIKSAFSIEIYVKQKGGLLWAPRSGKCTGCGVRRPWFESNCSKLGSQVSQKMPEPQFPHPSDGDKHSSQGCSEHSQLAGYTGALRVNKAPENVSRSSDSMPDHAASKGNYPFFVLGSYVLSEYAWGIASQWKSTLLFKTASDETLSGTRRTVPHSITYAVRQRRSRDKVRKGSTSPVPPELGFKRKERREETGRTKKAGVERVRTRPTSQVIRVGRHAALPGHSLTLSLHKNISQHYFPGNKTLRDEFCHMWARPPSRRALVPGKQNRAHLQRELLVNILPVLQPLAFTQTTGEHIFSARPDVTAPGPHSRQRSLEKRDSFASSRGRRTAKSGRRGAGASPYLEPFTWLGLHSILTVTLAGG